MRIFVRSVPWAATAALLIGCGEGGKPPAMKEKTQATATAEQSAAKAATAALGTAAPAGTAPAPAGGGGGVRTASDALPFVLPETLGIAHLRLGAVRRLPVVKRIEADFGPQLGNAARSWGPDAEILPAMATAEEIWVGVDATPVGRLPVGPYLVVRYPEPYDVKTFKNLLGPGVEPTDAVIEGKPAWTFAPPIEPESKIACLQADPKTLLLGFEPIVRKLAASRGASGPVAERLAGTSPTAHLRVAAVAGSWKPKLAQAADMLKEQMLQSPFDALPKLLPHLDSAAISFGFEDKNLLEISLGLDDDASAGAVETLLTEGWGEAKPLLGMAKQQAAGTAGDQALKVIDEVRTGVSVGRQGKSVTVALARPGSLDGAIDQAFAETLPKMKAAQERMQQINNLRNVALCMLQYAGSSDKWPADIRSADGKPILSWRVQILPYIERGDIYRQLKLDEPWDSEHNKPLTSQDIKLYRSPGVAPGHTAYFVFKGPGTPFPADGTNVSMYGIKDGTSNTLCIIAAKADRAVPWAKPSDLDFDPEKIAEVIAALPETDVHVAMLDCNVRVWKKLPKADVLKALITAAGGETIDPADLEGK